MIFVVFFRRGQNYFRRNSIYHEISYCFANGFNAFRM